MGADRSEDLDASVWRSWRKRALVLNY